MILVDSSAWIDYFRGIRPAVGDLVDEALESGEAAVTGLITTELLQGCTFRSDLNLIERLFRRVSTYFEPKEVWREAGLLSLNLRKRGTNIKTIDLVIAAMAIRLDLPLIASDSDFHLIANHTPLRLKPR